MLQQSGAAGYLIGKLRDRQRDKYSSSVDQECLNQTFMTITVTVVEIFPPGPLPSLDPCCQQGYKVTCD